VRGRNGKERRAVADAIGGGAAGDVPGGAVRRMDDIGGAGAQDGVSGSEHFGATAAFAEGGARRMGGVEEEAGVAGGVEDEYAGEGVGIPVEVLVATRLRRKQATAGE